MKKHQERKHFATTMKHLRTEGKFSFLPLKNQKRKNENCDKCYVKFSFKTPFERGGFHS